MLAREQLYGDSEENNMQSAKVIEATLYVTQAKRKHRFPRHF